VAELGAAFLCADLGITPEVREDHAAAHAQRAADYLNDLQPKKESVAA